MFDIGFWELGLIFLIGLIVLGPERLPKVARTLGLWARRARGYMQGITSELEREMDVDEMREHFRQTGKFVSKTREDFQSGVGELRDSVEQATGTVGGKRDHFRKARAARPSSAAGGSKDSPASSGGGKSPADSNESSSQPAENPPEKPGE